MEEKERIGDGPWPIRSQEPDKDKVSDGYKRLYEELCARVSHAREAMYLQSERAAALAKNASEKMPGLEPFYLGLTMQSWIDGFMLQKMVEEGSQAANMEFLNKFVASMKSISQGMLEMIMASGQNNGTHVSPDPTAWMTVMEGLSAEEETGREK